MKKLFATLVIGICAWGALSPTPGKGITLSLQPSTQSIALGGFATVEVVISGLGSGASPSLGGYLLEITYDPAVLLPTDVTFGPHLGAGSLSSWNLVLPNTLQLDETSSEDPAVLNSAQPASFTLATLTFQGLALGVSSLDFLSVDLVSEDPCCDLTATTSGASITVPDAGATSLLLALALAGLGCFRIRRSLVRA